MSSVAETPIPNKLTALRAIEELLDYAIAEGAELRLPFFVFLLRMAHLELDRIIADEGDNAPPAGRSVN